jgi:transposase InsO family protein
VVGRIGQAHLITLNSSHLVQLTRLRNEIRQLHRERDILKRAVVLFAKQGAVTADVQLLAAEAQTSVAAVCHALELPRAPHEAWCGDTTFIWTARGWVYVALLIDLCTRAIVGWAVSEGCDTELTLSCLDRAVARHQPRPGLLHHSDPDANYMAAAYRDRLRALGMAQITSGRETCWGNAVASSALDSITNELFFGHSPDDIQDVRHQLFEYIEGFHNRHRVPRLHG